MNSARAHRRRVSAAVTTVLAVTLGAGALAVPATAAPAPAPAPATGVAANAPLPFPKDASLAAAGKTGFLSYTWQTGYEWTRYADGATTKLDAGVVDSTASDVVVSGDGQDMRSSKVVKLHDMAAGGAPVAIDLGALKLTYEKGVSRDTVLATAMGADRSQPRLVTRTGAAVTQRTITGIPAAARGVHSTAARDGAVLVSYNVWNEEGSSPGYHLALVDLATASVVSTHDTDSVVFPDERWGFSAFSDTRLAWSEWKEDSPQHVVVADRATGEETRMRLGEGEFLTGGLLGSWVMYAEPSTLEGNGRGGGGGTLVPLRAKSPILDAPITLLDYTQRIEPGPDGTFLARGGTLDRGEGVYRIALGADGMPAAELIASTGEPTELVHLGERFPRTLDLDTNPALKWQLSRNNADIDLTITHRRTGKTFTKSFGLYTESAGSPYLCSDNVVCVSWSTIAAESAMGDDAHIGTYDWSFKATPQNGVGPAVEANGSFDGVKTSAPPRHQGQRHPRPAGPRRPGRAVADRHQVRHREEEPRRGRRAHPGRWRLAGLRPDRGRRRHRRPRRRRLRRPGPGRRALDVRRGRRRLQRDVPAPDAHRRRVEHVHPVHRRQRPDRRRPRGPRRHRQGG
ncbi:hypothetical protein [Streptomyces sp. Qhu_M48]|uniref:hypothetical protein n=1 Tax=Streptomyces sp. Qhu_M48 TaxID=3435889 RepID=UPI003F505B39